MLRASLPVFVLLFACASHKPEPVAEPAPPPEPTPDPAPEPEPDPAELAERALVDQLFASDDEDGQDIAIYLPASRTLYYLVNWHEEGTGTGIALATRVAGGDEETSEIQAPGDDPDAAPDAMIRAKQELLAKLRGQGPIALQATAWPTKPGADEVGPPLPKMSLAGFDETFNWARGKLQVKSKAGKVIAGVDAKKDAEPPHKPVPSALFAKPGVRTLLFQVTFDPGEQYGEGFNVYTATYVLELPPR